MISFQQPPNRTNHKAIHGPPSDLFTAEKERKVLAEDENTPPPLEERHASPFQPLFYCGSCGGVLLDCNLTDLSIPTNYLIRITRSLMNSVSWLRKWLLLQCPCEKNFSQKEIHSGGHLDDMEADWSKPIVSMRYLGNSLFYRFLQHFQPKEEVLVAGSIFLSLLFGLQGYFPFGWKV
ncbi:hypothetical protein NC652_000688 [Populus alba x Populus x berolinensis]|nr:hypothetical protein NC652_000688 [Populus alba x Populus x berolinensis]